MIDIFLHDLHFNIKESNKDEIDEENLQQISRNFIFG